MAATTHMKVEGLADIERTLKKLPRRNQKKIKRSALRAGADVVRQEIRDAIDEIPEVGFGGRLVASGKERFKKSIGIVTSKSNWYEGMIYVGPRYSGVKHIAPDAHLIEFGTDERTTKDGEARGRVQPTPFIRPGWEKSKRQAVEDTRRALVEKTIDEAIKMRRR